MDFRIIYDSQKRKFFPLTPEKIYNIPPKATHIRLYNGRVSFGASKDESFSVLKIKRTNKGKFVRIPWGISSIQFPGYYLNPSGHNYGQISFNPEKPPDAA